MKTVLVTGATDGIGKKMAELLAIKGYRVIVHGRNNQRVKEIQNFIIQSTGNKQIESIVADFTSFQRISDMVSCLKEKRLVPDILVNNAGIFESEKIILPNAIEKTFMVNYLAPYYLTRLLLPDMLMKKSPRIINVSSMAQIGTVDFNNLMGLKKFDGYEAYALSKLCNVLFTYYLHRSVKPPNMTVLCLHPGVISTKLLHTGWGEGGAPVLQGANRVVYAIEQPGNEVDGKYLLNNQPSKSAAISYDVRIQERLWNISAQLCNLSSNK